MKNLYLLASLFLATSLYAQTSLFSPDNRQEILSENLNDNEVKANYLILNTNAFLSESIAFHPFDDEHIIIDKNNNVSGNSWTGKIRNQQFGYFIISESKGVYFGKAVLDSGKIIIIRHQNNNIYRVSEISQDSVNIDEDCGEAETQLTTSDDTLDNGEVEEDYGPDICDTTETCSDVVMDVLVVYSDTLLAAQGSAATIEAAVQSAITEANLTLSNSQVGGTNHTFNVVAIEEISFLEDSSGSTNLGALRDNETVIDLRNRHSADLVALILNGGSCGIGNVNSDELGFSSTAGHSVTRWSCMTGNLTLTHEMGHNIGFNHNRYSTSNAGICGYGYGYVNENAASSTDQRWRTVMAYNAECSDQGFSCSRITYFSNPDVTIGTDADPAGKPIGDAAAANNAEILERSACHVAQFRTAPSCTDCIVYQNCENYATDFDSGPGNSLQIDISDTFASVVSTGTVQVCLNLYGDNNSASEQFSVITEDGTTVGTTSLGRDCEIPTRTCFTISATDYNSFIADGTISITIDPSASGVNPTLCSQNTACAEIVVENAVVLNTDNITINNAVKLYPNPSSSIINIEALSTIETVTIYSNIGKKIKIIRDNTSQIDISKLSKGLYFMKISSDRGTITKKIIKN